MCVSVERLNAVSVLGNGGMIPTTTVSEVYVHKMLVFSIVFDLSACFDCPYSSKYLESILSKYHEASYLHGIRMAGSRISSAMVKKVD